MNGNDKLEEETSNTFFSLTARKEVPQNLEVFFRTAFQNLKHCCRSIFFKDIHSTDRELIGELACRSVQNKDKSVKFPRYINHVCHANNMNAFFNIFRCSTCDTFFEKTGNLERYSVTCSKRVKHNYPNNFHELKKTIFDELDAFEIP